MTIRASNRLVNHGIAGCQNGGIGTAFALVSKRSRQKAPWPSRLIRRTSVQVRSIRARASTDCPSPRTATRAWPATDGCRAPYRSVTVRRRDALNGTCVQLISRRGGEVQKRMYSHPMRTTNARLDTGPVNFGCIRPRMRTAELGASQRHSDRAARGGVAATLGTVPEAELGGQPAVAPVCVPDLDRSQSSTDHWVNKHVPLYTGIPEVRNYVRHYVQCRLTDDRPNGPTLGRLTASSNSGSTTSTL